MIALDLDRVRLDGEGLVPIIVQSADDGRVLMLAYANQEALRATIETGQVHFYSRSRSRFWRKGETSGNTLSVRALAVDCDGDAVLAIVDPTGPTCHRGNRSCFDPEQVPSEPARSASVDDGRRAGPGPSLFEDSASFGWLDELWATISERLEHPSPASYTASLAARGVDAVGRKVAEEAIEVLLAAKDDATDAGSGAPETSVGRSAATRPALIGELADLLFHTLVLMAERRVDPDAVMDVLRSRQHPRP